MTMTTTAMIGSHERTAYTVEHRGDCVLITGAVPLSAFTVLAKLAPDGSVLDPDVARIWGVTFAFGLPDDLQELRKAGEIVSMQRERKANPELSQAAVRWLASGERGVSSNTIFQWLTGIDALKGVRMGHPYDPADFRRCRLLLEQVPELQPHFYRMREVSQQWSNLVDQWAAICATMDEELPDWREGLGGVAKKTYDLIKAAIGR